MKNFYFLFILFLGSLYTAAQTNFYRAYAQFSNSEPASIIQLPDSGYVIYSSDNNPDQELRRIDKHGNVIWHKKMLSSPTSEKAGAITLSSKNQILIAGRINNDVNLFRLDLNGNTIFKKVYSGSGAAPNAIVEDSWGNIYVVAWFAEVLKIDSTGTLKWKRSYPVNYIESIIPVSANRTILVGSAYSAVGVFSNTNIVHLFIDSTGTLIKQKAFGTNANDNTQDAFMDDSKKYFILADKETEITVTNAKGETVQKVKLEESTGFSFMLQNIPEGIYNITGTNKEGTLNEKVTIKE